MIDNPVMPGVALYCSDRTAEYGFGPDHPFGPDRQAAFLRALAAAGLDRSVIQRRPHPAADTDLMLFHEPQMVDFVRDRCAREGGYLDFGDTPALEHVYEAARYVVGATLLAVEDVFERRVRYGFVPIGGLHHAARKAAAGFCVFNDIGIAIESLRQRFGVRRIAYVDIDAHHGDGVFYGFEDDPDVIFADIHQDGRTLYPGTGMPEERGTGAAEGRKLNLSLPPGTGSEGFRNAWQQVEAFIDAAEPEFILMQCGADSLAGDPITDLALTHEDHAHAATGLAALAERHAGGRLVALGGGGYNRDNLGRAWSAVVAALLDAAREADRR
jgi:acetoin utilization protein AcuC